MQPLWDWVKEAVGEGEAWEREWENVFARQRAYPWARSLYPRCSSDLAKP